MTGSERMNYNKFRTYELRKEKKMATELKRITFAVPQDMEILLKCIKKDLFYDCSQSEMLRELISVGLNVKRNEKATVSDRCKERI